MQACCSLRSGTIADIYEYTLRNARDSYFTAESKFPSPPVLLISPPLTKASED